MSLFINLYVHNNGAKIASTPQGAETPHSSEIKPVIFRFLCTFWWGDRWGDKPFYKDTNTINSTTYLHIRPPTSRLFNACESEVFEKTQLGCACKTSLEEQWEQASSPPTSVVATAGFSGTPAPHRSAEPALSCSQHPGWRGRTQRPPRHPVFLPDPRLSR